MMATTKLRDIVVKTGEYQDRTTGETKGRYENVGALMQLENERGKSLFVMLRRTFNPAGAPNPDNRASVLLSCFAPQDRQQNGGGQSSSRPQGDPGPQPDDSRPDYDDDSVPF